MFVNTPIHHGLPVSAGGDTKNGIPTGTSIMSMASTTPEVNGVRYAPLYISYPILIRKASIEVVAAPATDANIRLGLYNANSSVQPVGSVVWDSGNIAVASGFTGTKTVSSLTISLNPGVYLACMNIDTTLDVRSFLVPSPFMDSGLGSSSLVKRLRANQTYGAFPSPGTQWTTVDTDNIGFQHFIAWQWTE